MQAAWPCHALCSRDVRDGEPRLAPARLDRSDEHEDWYVADVLVHNPETRYRFFLDVPAGDGASGYRWLNGRGTWDRDVPDAADFRLTVHDPAPAWMSDGVVYQVFPDRFARSRDADSRDLPAWAVPAAWGDEPHGAGPDVGTQLYGGDLTGVEERLDHLVALGVSTLYTTPVFPGRSNHRYDASTFDHVDPLLGGDAAYASPRNMTVPEDLARALAKRAKAKRLFSRLDAQNRYAILYRIHDAKRPDTRARRIAKYVDMLDRGETIY